MGRGFRGDLRRCGRVHDDENFFFYDSSSSVGSLLTFFFFFLFTPSSCCYCCWKALVDLFLAVVFLFSLLSLLLLCVGCTVHFCDRFHEQKKWRVLGEPKRKKKKWGEGYVICPWMGLKWSFSLAHGGGGGGGGANKIRTPIRTMKRK